MIICSDRHEEVVSERHCIACMMRDHYEEKMDELKQEITQMEETAEGYQERIETLQADIEELQSGKAVANA